MTSPNHESTSSILVTVEEAAIILRLGRTSMYGLILDGRVPSVKLGRRRLVLRSALHRFVEELATQQTEVY